MRSKRWAAAAVAAAALTAVPIATAGMMHPQLGAQLSGMGEHGVVNLHVAHSKGHALLDVRRARRCTCTGASVRDGTG